MNAADLDQYQQIATRYQNKKPLRDWHQLMVKSDHIMTRSVEDLIAYIGVENLPAPLQEKYAEKLALRAQKPESQIE